MNSINWPQYIADIVARGYTLQQIADECGFASKGALHDLKSSKSATCSYERGCALVLLHKRVMRRKVLAS